MRVEYRGYYITPFAAVPSCYVISTEGRGGKIPRIMEGVFTSRSVANSVIDLYLEIPKEEQVNDKKVLKRGV